VCMLIAQRWINQLVPDMARLFLENRSDFRKEKTAKIFLSLIPSDGDSCSLETEQDTERMPKKGCLFHIDYRTKATIPTNCPGFHSRQRWFCSSETKCNKRTAPRPKDCNCLFVWRLQEQRPQP
jgi:hypothetical protein